MAQENKKAAAETEGGIQAQNSPGLVADGADGKDNPQSEIKTELVDQKVKDEQAEAFLEAFKADDKEKAKILAKHPELQKLFDLIDEQKALYKDDPLFQMALRSGAYENLIAQDIRESKINLHDSTKEQGIAKESELRNQVETSARQALADVSHAMETQVLQNQMKQNAAMQNEASDVNPAVRQGETGGQPSNDMPGQSAGVPQQILQSEQQAEQSKVNEKYPPWQNRALFLHAVNEETANQRLETMANHPELRGAITKYTMIEESFKNGDNKISPSEQLQLNYVKENMAKMFEPGHQAEIDNLNQSYDAVARAKLTQQQNVTSQHTELIT